MSENHRFVVATHSFLLAIETDAQWRLQNLHVLARGHHYGIALPAANGDRFIAKGRGELLTLYQPDGARGGGYLAAGERLLGEEFGEIHQIAQHEGLLFFANTGRNSLVWADADGAVLGRYHFGGKEEDIDHINSVFPLGSGRVACLLHGRGRRPSQIAILQLHGRTQIELLHRGFLRHMGCHNLFVDRQRLVYNASEVGKVVTVDVRSGRIERELRFPGHTKGLSMLDRAFIVGYSDRVERALRTHSRGHLAVIDRRTLETKARIDLNHPALPQPAGNVNEIRCLSHAEYGQHTTDAEALTAALRRLTSYSAAGRLQLLTRAQATRSVAIAKSFWRKRVWGKDGRES